MLAIYPLPININPLKKVPNNANINLCSFHHDIVECNSGKSNIYCQLYIPYVHQYLKLLIINKGAELNVGKIPWKLFFVKQCLSCVKLTLNVGYFFHLYSF